MSAASKAKLVRLIVFRLPSVWSSEMTVLLSAAFRFMPFSPPLQRLLTYSCSTWACMAGPSGRWSALTWCTHVHNLAYSDRRCFSTAHAVIPRTYKHANDISALKVKETSMQEKCKTRENYGQNWLVPLTGTCSHKPGCAPQTLQNCLYTFTQQFNVHRSLSCLLCVSQSPCVLCRGHITMYRTQWELSRESFRSDQPNNVHALFVTGFLCAVFCYAMFCCYCASYTNRKEFLRGDMTR